MSLRSTRLFPHLGGLLVVLTLVPLPVAPTPPAPQAALVLSPSVDSRPTAPDAKPLRLHFGSADSTGARLADDSPVTMRIGARVQVRYLHEDGDGERSVHIRRARMSLSGDAYEDFGYSLQVELAGAGARLLDAAVTYRASPHIALWIGQGKAPFGRQQLTSSGSLQFVDRTIVDGRFAAGRQQGAAVLGRLAGDLIEYGAGLYNGEGTNQTANPGGRFMTVGRIVVTPLGPYAPVESAHDAPERPRVAIGVAGLQNTVEDEGVEVEVTRVNGEAAFKLRGLSLVAETYREWLDPGVAGRDVTDGWYGQVSYLLPGLRHEVAGRYAVVSPATNTDTTEAGIGYSYYLQGHRMKLQADLRRLRFDATGAELWQGRVQFQLSL